MSVDQRGSACECIVMNDEWPDDTEECLHEDPNTGLKCTRPEGHTGVHAGCSLTQHPAMAWPNEAAEEGSDA